MGLTNFIPKQNVFFEEKERINFEHTHNLKNKQFLCKYKALTLDKKIYCLKNQCLCESREYCKIKNKEEKCTINHYLKK